jgi:hypothetical protein
MPKFGEERLKAVFKYLEEIKVFTLIHLMSALGCSMPGARVKLKQWKAYTSYNQNGRYYTLPTVPCFDDNGLWFYEDVFFCRYGNLRNTVVHLVNHSSSGLTGNEIGKLIRLSPRSFLHHFRNVGGIHREKIEDIYVYFSADPVRYKEQVRQRSDLLTTTQKSLTEADAVVILAALIRHHGISEKDIMALPEIQTRKIPAFVVREFLDRHGLLKKLRLQSDKAI